MLPAHMALPVPPTAPTADLRTVLARHDVLTHKVERLETELAEAKEALRIVREIDLPTLLDGLGIESLKLDDGRTLRVGTVVNASVPKRNLPAIIEWLDRHGYGALVERKLFVPLGRDQQELAERLSARLLDMGVAVMDESTVNTARLKSLASELLSEGREVPLDLMGIYARRAVTITTR